MSSHRVGQLLNHTVLGQASQRQLISMEMGVDKMVGDDIGVDKMVGDEMGVDEMVETKW